jgi:hypothetical protein
MRTRTNRSGTSRSEVSGKVEKHATDMREKSEEIEKTVCDVETERHTEEAVDLNGTTEAADAVEQALDAAERTSNETFDREGGELEQAHGEAEQFEGELQERSEAMDSDREKLSEAGGSLHHDDARSEIAKASECAQRDIEFLREHAARAQAVREQSRHLHEQHKGRVQSQRGN